MLGSPIVTPSEASSDRGTLSVKVLRYQDVPGIAVVAGRMVCRQRRRPDLQAVTDGGVAGQGEHRAVHRRGPRQFGATVSGRRPPPLTRISASPTWV